MKTATKKRPASGTDGAVQRLTVEQALASLRVLWLLAKQDKKAALSWIGSNLVGNKKEAFQEKVETRENTTIWMAPLALQAQNATDPTLRKKLREAIAEQQKEWQAEIDQIAHSEQEATLANAREALEALGRSDEARGKALYILEGAIYAQVEQQRQTKLDRAPERARGRAEKIVKRFSESACRLREAETGKRGKNGKVVQWGALSNGGDALPDAPLLREAIKKVNEALDALECWRRAWEDLKPQFPKQARRGHPEKPWQGKALKTLLDLYARCGISKKPAQDHTIALMHAAGLYDTAVGEAVRFKLSSLQKSSRSPRP